MTESISPSSSSYSIMRSKVITKTVRTVSSLRSLSLTSTVSPEVSGTMLQCDRTTNNIEPTITSMEMPSASILEVDGILVVVLGALLGLSVLILIATIIGWTYTCKSKNKDAVKLRNIQSRYFKLIFFGEGNLN